MKHLIPVLVKLALSEQTHPGVKVLIGSALVGLLVYAVIGGRL